jgi:hypothetical protein
MTLPSLLTVTEQSLGSTIAAPRLRSVPVSPQRLPSTGKLPSNGENAKVINSTRSISRMSCVSRSLPGLKERRFTITLDSNPISLKVTTYKGDDGYKRSDQKGSVIFYIVGVRPYAKDALIAISQNTYENTTEDGTGLNNKVLRTYTI